MQVQGVNGDETMKIRGDNVDADVTKTHRIAYPIVLSIVIWYGINKEPHKNVQDYYLKYDKNTSLEYKKFYTNMLTLCWQNSRFKCFTYLSRSPVVAVKYCIVFLATLGKTYANP